MKRYPGPDMDAVAGVLDRRVEALVIDAILFMVVMSILGFAGSILMLGTQSDGLAAAVVVLQLGSPFVLLFYYIGFEGYYGQTVGKRLRGIVVVREDGSPCTWGAAVVRNLLRVIDVLPGFYIAGIVFAYATSDHQRIGDYLGNTVVVHTE